MQKTHKYIFIVGGLLAFFLWSYKEIKHFVSPHYLDNRDVKIDQKLYSPDSSIAIVYYTLDVGARGTREYKTLLRESDYDKDLMTFNIPPDLVVVKWIDNKSLAVKYDPNESLRVGGLSTDLDLQKDTLTRNGIKLIVIERTKKESFVP